MNKKIGITVATVIIVVILAFMLLPRAAMPPSASTKIDSPSKQ